ncbi:hypothetical protein CLV35_2445 [Motilibacter peucedani]|uniref:VOC domain-containing protein n=1 Tax=Motilibacter peucedani TaxID=598650 RepID=A0A420XP19_9ACTN|nr:VOC family protein [Motilibacter peucedani]RKS73949.1 hypothetical protein CLV35_2445 [Motilibacter peucedani]
MAHSFNMVTLGVQDLARSRAFYEALGWQGRGGEGGAPVFFGGHGTVLAIWDRSSLAADSALPEGSSSGADGWGGITLACCLGSEAEVDELTATARGAGGTVAREPAATSWGGYDSIVVDPDGHRWEIAHNPEWPVSPEGGVSLG